MPDFEQTRQFILRLVRKKNNKNLRFLNTKTSRKNLLLKENHQRLSKLTIRELGESYEMYVTIEQQCSCVRASSYGLGYRANGVFIWEISSRTVTEISYEEALGRKNRDLGNRASPASHMNTSKF